MDCLDHDLNTISDRQRAGHISLDKDIEVLRKTVKDLVQKLDDGLNGANRAFKSIEENVLALDQRGDRHRSMLSSHEKRFRSMEEKFESAWKRIEDLEDEVAGLARANERQQVRRDHQPGLTGS